MADQDARIAALEAALAALQQQLADSQVRRSMASTGRCPSCGSGALVNVRHVTDHGGRGLADFALVKTESVWTGIDIVGGRLEAFVCRSCRLVEWRALAVDDIVADGKDIVEQTTPDDPAPDGGPFR